MKRQPWMSYRQAATRLGVTHTTIKRLVDKGRLTLIWLTPLTKAISVASVQGYEISLERRNQKEQERPVVRTRREICSGV